MSFASRKTPAKEKRKSRMRNDPEYIALRERTDICGAMVKRTGKPCQKAPIKGKHRCHMHGGTGNPVGPRHHAFKTGRSSQFTKHLPEKMRESFEASLNDPDILSVRSEIALIRERLFDLAQRLTTGESADRMSLLFAHVKDLQESLLEMDKSDPVVRSLIGKTQTIQGILRESFGEDSVWSKIQAVLSSRVQLTDTERKLLEFKKANIDADRLHVLVNQILSSVRQRVMPLPGGGPAVHAVATDLLAMLGIAPGQGAASVAPSDDMN